MRNLVLVVVAALAACGDNLAPSQPTGEYVVEMCGPSPLAPGVVVAFENERVSMSRETYLDLARYREATAAWRDCVVELP